MPFMSSIDIEKSTSVSETNGDHDLFAHYVEKNQVTEALVLGIPVIALCGKIWIPSRDPDKYPVCPACKDIYESIAK